MASRPLPCPGAALPASSSPLSCPQCGSPFRASDLRGPVAACQRCDRLFPVAAREARPPLLQPEAWTVEGEPGSRRLIYRWWGLDAVIYLAIGLLFAGTGSLAFLTPQGPAPVFLGHWAVGVFLLYLGLCKCVNRTTYELGEGRFRVRHGPLWWPGAIDLPVEALHQLFVKRSSVRVNKQPRWRVMAADRHGVLHRASPLMPSLYHARWLEQTVEEELGIVDQRMIGEV